MPEVKAFKCDHCGQLIADDRDVYRLRMEGREWREGPPMDTCQNTMMLGFCRACSRKILVALEHIAERIHDKST